VQGTPLAVLPSPLRESELYFEWRTLCGKSLAKCPPRADPTLYYCIMSGANSQSAVQDCGLMGAGNRLAHTAGSGAGKWWPGNRRSLIAAATEQNTGFFCSQERTDR